MSNGHFIISFEGYLDRVFVYGPNILNRNILTDYPSILNDHDIVDLSYYARVALLYSGRYFQPSKPFDIYWSKVNMGCYKTDVFMRGVDMFNVLHDELCTFQKKYYPIPLIEKYSKLLEVQFSHLSSVCIPAHWLYFKLVSNRNYYQPTPFVVTVAHEIIKFNRLYRVPFYEHIDSVKLS
ncbi:MAG: hypothetical protein E7046_01005 [Lentisphaerae bacterium]|nr:hypothetical protein [Lentisphaerota bacterium]